MPHFEVVRIGKSKPPLFFSARRYKIHVVGRRLRFTLYGKKRPMRRAYVFCASHQLFSRQWPDTPCNIQRHPVVQFPANPQEHVIEAHPANSAATVSIHPAICSFLVIDHIISKSCRRVEASAQRPQRLQRQLLITGKLGCPDHVARRRKMSPGLRSHVVRLQPPQEAPSQCALR